MKVTCGLSRNAGGRQDLLIVLKKFKISLSPRCFLRRASRMSHKSSVSQRFLLWLVSLALGVLAVGSATAQQPGKKPRTENAKPAEAAAPKPAAADESASGDDQDENKGPWHGLTWRLIGPYRGGRALAVSGVIGDP